MTFPGPPRLHMCHRCTSCVGSACASRVSAWEGRYQDGRQTESLWGPQTIALGVLSCNVSGEAQRVPPAVSVSERGQESPGLQWWVFCPVSWAWNLFWSLKFKSRVQRQNDHKGKGKRTSG